MQANPPAQRWILLLMVLGFAGAWMLEVASCGGTRNASVVRLAEGEAEGLCEGALEEDGRDLRLRETLVLLGQDLAVLAENTRFDQIASNPPDIFSGGKSFGWSVPLRI